MLFAASGAESRVARLVEDTRRRSGTASRFPEKDFSAGKTRQRRFSRTRVLPHIFFSRISMLPPRKKTAAPSVESKQLSNLELRVRDPELCIGLALRLGRLAWSRAGRRRSSGALPLGHRQKETRRPPHRATLDFPSSCHDAPQLLSPGSRGPGVRTRPRVPSRSHRIDPHAPGKTTHPILLPILPPRARTSGGPLLSYSLARARRAAPENVRSFERPATEPFCCTSPPIVYSHRLLLFLSPPEPSHEAPPSAR